MQLLVFYRRIMREWICKTWNFLLFSSFQIHDKTDGLHLRQSMLSCFLIKPYHCLQWSNFIICKYYKLLIAITLCSLLDSVRIHHQKNQNPVQQYCLAIPCLKFCFISVNLFFIKKIIYYWTNWTVLTAFKLLAVEMLPFFYIIAWIVDLSVTFA